MKRILIFTVFLFCLFPLMSQHLIGKKKQDVEKIVKIMYPGMVPDRSTVNHTFKYLKFVDNTGEQTFLVFLSGSDVCTATRLISSYSGLTDIIKKLNKWYRPSGKDIWKYSENGIKYLVKLKRENWFFSVFTGEVR